MAHTWSPGENLEPARSAVAILYRAHSSVRAERGRFVAGTQEHTYLVAAGLRHVRSASQDLPGNALEGQDSWYTELVSSCAHYAALVAAVPGHAASVVEQLYQVGSAAWSPWRTGFAAKDSDQTLARASGSGVKMAHYLDVPEGADDCQMTKALTAVLSTLSDRSSRMGLEEGLCYSGPAPTA